MVKVKAIRARQFGGPEVLKWEDVEIGEPKEGEIRIKNKASGLNFIDVHYWKGVYKAKELPFIPGREAVGVVTAIGPGVTGRQIGDIAGYAGDPMGSYAQEQILPDSQVLTLPSPIDPVTGAAVLLKGMTARYLLRNCFKVEAGHRILVHAAAGGVGSLCQWAKALGATVIGTVSTKDKAELAAKDGCDYTIMYTKENFVESERNHRRKRSTCCLRLGRQRHTSGFTGVSGLSRVLGELWPSFRCCLPCFPCTSGIEITIFNTTNSDALCTNTG